MSLATLQADRVILISGIPFHGKVSTFNYYESLLSPFITANLTYVDTGNTAENKNDIQNRTGTLRDALPLRGDEKVTFKFQNIMGSIDFNTDNEKFLVVDDSMIISRDSTTEYGAIRLISPTYKKNYENSVYEKYYGQIGSSVKKIASQKLGISQDNLKVENAITPYNFTGSGREPYEILYDLASQSKPQGGDPGYFVYETKSGFYFRSIDSLMDQKPINDGNPYFQTDVFKSDLVSNTNAYKIIGTPTQKDVSVSKLIKSGTFFAEFRFMYEDQQTVKTRYFRLEENGRFESVKNPTNLPTRTYTIVIPRGMADSKISKSANNDPVDVLARSVMRYNILMSQAINILIPCNPTLEAGDIIQCKFEKVTSDSKSLGSFDIGNYLILNLCHQFTGKDSYTSLTIVKDTYGRKAKVG